ncbi:tRNA selenocysteine 1-associated protein 1 isoform X3 [Tribolium castaneum]|uniref:tRNA selenocysteine 1-associated protein 1 isoform X3 n=1 Tax=Tribolium castaneum TaxID=7070 RepID=UPI00046C0401|nr:PREDICTED: tRNA selenocysteine 1-associated protein 1 isoform X3 [Tribolium castaneum]|eukprot:XP_008195447.1 PREDICTED: tRNA selenocysteine 1-associated protein 1 isoform X3 [Tribolium castaneum]
MANMVHCQLWMGSLEPYMTETFIISAFRKMGENPLNVKVMRNKFTGEAAGYCFVHFANDEEAIDAMHKLNGKPIPGTTPVVRFRLNNASNTGRTLLDHSSGFSKGYGFVRFGSEDEMRDSLTTMNGYIGLGTKALKICNAVPKPKGALTTGTPSATSTTSTYTAADYSQFYDPSTYWQNYANWQTGYYEQGDGTGHEAYDMSNVMMEKKEEDLLELIDHSLPLDVDKINRERIEQDCNLWDALESSKWLPCEALEVN